MKFAKEIYKEYPKLLTQRSEYFRKVYNSFGVKKKFRNYLDVGCGKGYNTKAFQTIAKKYSGIEPGKEDLEEAKKNNPNGKFLQGSALDIPFENESFEAISSFSVLEHIGNLEDALDEITRVLSRNGTLILQQPNRFFLVELHTYLPFTYIIPFRIRKYFLKKLGYSEDAILATQMSVKSLLKKLEKRRISTQVVKMTYPEEIIPQRFRTTYRLLRKLGVFEIVPFGYFIIGTKK